ncbi:MAG: AMP-binding protein, partial [Clostridia bacterium]|nr:AMP-binding protein [Clostridia bacterium]
MKLSFSTKGWHGRSFDALCDMAEATGFSGIELHNINGPLFTDRDGAFYGHAAAATKRRLYDRKLSLPCLDVLSDPAATKFEAAKDEILRCLAIAGNLGISMLRVRTDATDAEAAREKTARLIGAVLPEAEAQGVTILIETSGVFAKTEVLRDILEQFASDRLAALWEVAEAYLVGGEEPEAVVRNLGAYIRHVHFSDIARNKTGFTHVLMGEGEIPFADVMRALRSVNYDGFLSLVWDPAWCPELDDMEIVLAQFEGYMKQFSDPKTNEHTLYWNRAHTGNFPWKKDLLIDATFPDVLDKMVEEFPDQYAFRYTTLDYTRTYTEFRADVDEFARALIALGVRAGHHVAVWATNVPQWYIAFWATTKIGAVLVTMNTAYKIHEAEYLLKQSDTHTLVMVEGFRDSDYAGIMAELCPELASVKPGQQLHARRLPFLRNVITVGFRQKGCLTWEEALCYADKVPAEELRRMAAKVSPDDVCNMQYTSGTTGFPKGVMLTHRNIVNNGKCIGDRMDLSTADRMMIQVPMFHCFGMVLAMTASMTHGVTMSPIPAFSPRLGLECINREKITA